MQAPPFLSRWSILAHRRQVCAAHMLKANSLALEAELAAPGPGGNNSIHGFNLFMR